MGKVIALTIVVLSLAMAAPAQAVPQWLKPVDVAGPSSVNMTGDVAVAPDGTALVAYSANVGGKYREFARIRRPGQGFGQVFELTPADGRESGPFPQVAVDQAGNFTVAWDELRPPTFTVNAIRAARLPAGAGAFEPVETVSDGTTDAISPQLAVGGKGTAVIAYKQDNVVKAAIRQGAGGGFGTGNAVSDANPTGYDVAVDDAGNAVVVWSRTVVAGTDVVEASERPVNLGFPPASMATPLSSTTAGDKSTGPSLAMTPNGRVLVLWTHQVMSGPFEVQYIEREPNGTWMAAPLLASKATEAARLPDVAIAANGTAVAAWIADIGSGESVQGAVRAAGGSFMGYRNFPSTTVGVPQVASNRAGDTVVAWGGFMGEGVLAVRRPAGGTFGGVDTVGLGTQGAADPAISLQLQAVGLDDQGNAITLWRRNAFSSSAMTNDDRLQTASFDAAPPRIDALSVPASGAPGAAIGMAATASDRLSSPTLTWSFGDGKTGSGPAVSHAYGTPGAYSVTVTATDGAGNSTSASRSVVIANPVVQPPPPTPRIDSPVFVTWGVNKKSIYLLRLKVTKVPKGGKVQLRCKGRKCPFKRSSSSKRRKRAITLYKEIKATKVVGNRKRSFRAGQRLQLRITAPGFVGKVVNYDLKQGKIPSGRQLCLPPGAKTPRKC